MFSCCEITTRCSVALANAGHAAISRRAGLAVIGHYYSIWTHARPSEKRLMWRGRTFLSAVGFLALGTSLCLPFFTSGLVESSGLWATLSCCRGARFWSAACLWMTGSPPPTGGRYGNSLPTLPRDGLRLSRRRQFHLRRCCA